MQILTEAHQGVWVKGDHPQVVEPREGQQQPDAHCGREAGGSSGAGGPVNRNTALAPWPWVGLNVGSLSSGKDSAERATEGGCRPPND